MSCGLQDFLITGRTAPVPFRREACGPVLTNGAREAGTREGGREPGAPRPLGLFALAAPLWEALTQPLPLGFPAGAALVSV